MVSTYINLYVFVFVLLMYTFNTANAFKMADGVDNEIEDALQLIVRQNKVLR
jgi:hypothetical protein